MQSMHCRSSSEAKWPEAAHASLLSLPMRCIPAELTHADVGWVISLLRTVRSDTWSVHMVASVITAHVLGLIGREG